MTMTTYHVGGLNPIRRFKTLQDAVDKASYDDIIEIHKTIQETVVIEKPLQIKGNGNTWTVDAGKMGLMSTQPIIIDNVIFEIGSRSNAIVSSNDIILNEITTKLKGPIVAFYPTIWMKKGRNRINNSVVTRIHLDEIAELEMNDTTIYAYYGPDIETSDRDECSTIKGPMVMNSGYISSTTVYDAQLNNTRIGKFVRIHDAELNDIRLDLEWDEKILKYCPTGKKLKKEPTHGPIASKTGNNYHLYLTGNISINNYKLENINKDTTGFHFANAHVSVTNVDSPKTTTGQTLTHRAYKTSLSFRDSIDENFWNLDDSTLQQVRSEIATNSKQKSAMEQLDELIGLANVKQQLRTLLNTIKIDRNQGFSNHMIFAGNAGTGKTTVAKLVAQALFEVGAIPENKCTFATNDTLVKGYIGQTGENVAQILEGALGGVLFIDEAYQLTVKEGERSFNDEVISVLIRYMEDHRDDLVVIAAGYSKEMRQFLASNMGLSRRFQWIEFDDYTPEEMVEIFELMRKSHDDQYGADVDPRIILPLFRKLVELNLSRPDANGRITNGGNGGLVRNIYQRITLAKNDRYVEQGGDLTINKADIVKGFEGEMKQTLQKTGA